MFFLSNEEKEIIQLAVQGKTNLSEDEEQQICAEIVDSLTEDEKEIAARSSYRYMLRAISENLDQRPSKNEQFELALQMARRHLVAAKGDKEKAMIQTKKTIQYRKEINIDAIRRCFNKDDDEYDSQVLLNTRKKLEPLLKTGFISVVGYSKFDETLFIDRPSKIDDFSDQDACLKANIYMFERALASSESKTNGRKEKVIVIFDYNGVERKNVPPIDFVKTFFSILRDHYPERLEKTYLVDAPVLFWAFFNIIKHFIDPVTTQKIRFTNGEEEKRKTFSNLFSLDQVMPFMLPEGKIPPSLDMNEFLHEVPYNRTYSERN